MKIKLTNFSLILFSLAIMSSPTLLAVYEFILLIAGVSFLLRGETYPYYAKNSTIKILCIFISWLLIANIVNIVFRNVTFLEVPSFMKLSKYFLLILVFLTPYFIYCKNIKQKQMRLLLSFLMIAIVLGFFAGISKSYFNFDPIYWKQSFVHFRISGFLGHYVRYGDASAFFALFSGLILFRNRMDFMKLVSRKWSSLQASERVYMQNLVMLVVICMFSYFGVLFARSLGGLLILLLGVSVYYIKLYRFHWFFPVILMLALLVNLMIIFGIVAKIQNQTWGSQSIDLSTASSKLEETPYQKQELEKIITDKELAIEEDSIRSRINTTQGQRFDQYKAALYVIQKNPWFGVGGGKFHEHSIAAKQKLDLSSLSFKSHSHNIFLEIAANYGIPALLLYIMFLLAWIKQLWTRGDPLSIGFLCYISAYIAAGQFEALFDVHNMSLFMLIFIISQIHTYSSGLQNCLKSNVSLIKI